jgi:hypothetical protein
MRDRISIVPEDKLQEGFGALLKGDDDFRVGKIGA